MLPESTTGSILFGGIDTAKYTGSLSSLTTLQGTGPDITEFLVAMTSVSATSSSGSDSLTSSGFAVAAVLDSGTSYTLLPNDIAQSIFDEFGATDVLGYAVVPCALAQKNGTINYIFGGPNGVVVKQWPRSSALSPQKLIFCLVEPPGTQTANPPASLAFRTRLGVV
jgi:Eukaryotic aspartyl protease